MTLDEIFKNFCDNLNEVDVTSKKFASLKTDKERFAFAYQLFQGFVPQINFKQVGKNNCKSRNVREKGNECFKNNQYWKALSLYSQSIALAEVDSEELALSLGNRAACLLRLKRPKESLEDVEEVLSLSIRQEYREKILKRKENCTSCLESGDIQLIDFGCQRVPSLTGGRSSYFDSASSVVALMSNDDKGRHLVATDNIKSGDVLIVEKPYSSILLPDYFYTHCAYCLKRSLRLIPCPRCTTSMYCSQNCLIESEKKNHEVECSFLEHLVNLKAWRMELLSVRILIDASKQGRYLKNLANNLSEIEMNSYEPTTYCAIDHLNVYNLIGNTEKRSVADLFSRTVKSCIFVLLLDKYSHFFRYFEDPEKEDVMNFSGGIILRYLQSLPCNAHEVSEFCDEGGIEIGAGVYATLSLINHSCEPNVVRHSYGDVVALTVIRPIKYGEEIVDNYGYHYATHSLTERQSALLKQYYFTCQCEACVKKWPLFDDIPEESTSFKVPFDKEVYKTLTVIFKKNLDAVFKGEFTDQMLLSFYKYLDFLDEHFHRPWKPYNKCQEAIKYCLSYYGNRFKFSKGLPDHNL